MLSPCLARIAVHPRITQRDRFILGVVQFEYDGLDRIATERWFDEATPMPSISITTTTDGGLTDEVQRVGFHDDMLMLYGGTFTLTFDGQTTGSLDYNADADAVQSALEGLSNIAPGDVMIVKLQKWNPHGSPSAHAFLSVERLSPMMGDMNLNELASPILGSKSSLPESFRQASWRIRIRFRWLVEFTA